MLKKNLTDRDGEVRELTRGDIVEMKPFEEVFLSFTKTGGEAAAACPRNSSNSGSPCALTLILPPG
jgi:hypothetical protein